MKTAIVSLIMCLCAGTAYADELYKQGKQVFEQSQPSCAICHTLADAGSAGDIGPNLNDLKPSEDQVWKAVNGGVGIMPNFSDSLSQEQMKAVAHYVAKASQQ